MLRNDSVGAALSFTEIAGSAGLVDGQWGWGTTWLDADADGWLDLAHTNGFMNAPYDTDESRLYLNDGVSPLSFSDVSATAGMQTAFG